LAIVVPASADRPDLQVRRDGAIVGRAAWGTPIPVDPGSHAIEVTAEGRKTWKAQPRVAGPGANVSIEVPTLDVDTVPPPMTAIPPTPAPAAQSTVTTPPAATTETKAASNEGGTQRAIGLVVAGAGVAGLITGGIAGAMAKSKYDSASGQCNGSVCNAQGISSIDSAKSAATVSTVAFAAGGGLIAAGVVVFLVAPKAQPATGWMLTPASDGAVAGVTVRRAW
jgi:hypothetical protein